MRWGLSTGQISSSWWAEIENVDPIVRTGLTVCERVTCAQAKGLAVLFLLGWGHVSGVCPECNICLFRHETVSKAVLLDVKRPVDSRSYEEELVYRLQVKLN